MQIREIIFPTVTVASLLRFHEGRLLKTTQVLHDNLTKAIYKRKKYAILKIFNARRGKASNGINSIKWLTDVVRQKTAPGHLTRARGVRVGRALFIFFTCFYCISL